MSEFREASRESLFLTGTPSVCNLKFQMRLHCAGNPSSLQTVASFAKILCIRVLVLELPTQWFKALSDECHINPRLQRMFMYSRSSVGNPDLKNISTFIKAVYNIQPFTAFTANFENVLKIRYNDARLR